ncbi:MAG: hypothetical protein E6Q97_24920, partial [Desulfurellales bacterium]
DDKIVVAGFGSTDPEVDLELDFIIARYTAAGALDTSFGTGGIVTTDILGDDNVITALALQSDGKIVVTGYAYDGAKLVFATARYNSDGTLDSGFGSGGIVTTAFFTSDAQANAIAIQSDGKIVVAGFGRNTNNDFSVVRYTSAGALDTGFGTGGKKQVSVGTNDGATGIAIQSDGKIVVTGYAQVSTPDYDWCAIRLTSAGALDTGFGSSGIAIIDTGTGNENGDGIAVALQSDGSVILAGLLKPGGTESLGVARLTSAGALDTSFGSSGFVTSGVSGGYVLGSAVIVDGSDRVLVCGWGDDGSGLWRAVRLTAAGAFDASFGTGGIADLRDEIEAGNCSALALQPDGKILLGGSVWRDGFLACGLMRLNADGTEDTLFGSALTISAGAATLGPLVADGTLATAVVLDAGSATLGPLVAAGELYLSLLLSPGAAAIGLTAAGTITLTNAPLQAGSATLGPLTAAGALAISRPIPPHVLATRYSLTLTGAADGLPDAALPLANWQSVARLVGSTYLTCTVPLSSAIEAAILARPHGTLIVRQHLIYASETITAEIVAAPWDAAPRIDEGGRSASITLAGLAPQPARAPKSVALRGVSYRRLDSGVTVRSAIDLFAAPGDTLDYGDGDLVADQITYICTPGAEWMEARSDG